jgi:ribosome-associated protein
MVVDAAADKKADDIVLLDLRNLALIADYFVLCNGQSSRQLKAIADGIVKTAKDQGEQALSVEGGLNSGWVLIDFGAVVVHVFSPELRHYYKLEELWQEAPVVVRMQ